jgi:hypothetical protein
MTKQKQTPKGKPRIYKNRKGMIPVEKDEAGKKKIPFQIKYISPAPYVSDLSHSCIDSYHIRSILICDVRLDGIKSKKSIVMCPFRDKVLETLKFKFGVKKFYLAEITVLKSVGVANKN